MYKAAQNFLCSRKVFFKRALWLLHTTQNVMKKHSLFEFQKVSIFCQKLIELGLIVHVQGQTIYTYIFKNTVEWPKTILSYVCLAFYDKILKYLWLTIFLTYIAYCWKYFIIYLICVIICSCWFCIWLMHLLIFLQVPFCPPEPRPPEVIVPPPQFEDDMLSLLHSQMYTDVIFLTGKVGFAAHKSVLSAVCNSLYKLFTLDLTPETALGGRSASDSSVVSFSFCLKQPYIFQICLFLLLFFSLKEIKKK